MYLYLLLLSIAGGVFLKSALFLDPMNDSKCYFLLIISIIILIDCFVSKNGFQKLQRAIQSHGLFVGMIIFCFLSSLLGLFQYIGFFTSNHDSFSITGTFENPAGFATVQSCMFPFVFFNCFESERNKIERLLSVVVSIFCILVVVLSGSRAGFLAICSAMITMLAFQRKVRLSFQTHKWLWIALLLVLISLLVLLYFLKQDSANGRWFIWNRSLEIIKEHPLFGSGYSGFHKLYMEHQADYFKLFPDSPYVMIADNVRHPFNEYIKLTCQYGIIGLSGAFCFLVYLVIKLLKSPDNTKQLGLSYISSLFVMCQFSYPFNYHVVWLFSFIALSPVFFSPEMEFRLFQKIRFIVIPFLFVFLFFSARRMYYEMKLTEVTKRTMMGKARRMIPNFEDVDRIMGNSPLFNYNYAVLLHSVGRCDESLTQVTKCKEKWNEYSTQMLLAKVYQELGQTENAVQAYEEAHNMVPCRFEPLYGKLVVYYESNDTMNIIRTAYDITEKPIKVQSDRVKQIKANAFQAIEIFSED